MDQSIQQMLDQKQIFGTGRSLCKNFGCQFLENYAEMVFALHFEEEPYYSKLAFEF